MQLTKEDGPADIPSGVAKLRAGLSWDTTGGGSGGLKGRFKRERGTDLDLLGIAMQGENPVRMAGLDSLDPMKNGSVVHTGDNQTGKGEGDDETIICDLFKIPDVVTSIIFVCAAYKPGSSLAKAANVAMKVYDDSDGAVLCNIWPSLMATGNACRIARVVRSGALWQVEVINEMGSVTQGNQNSLMMFAVRN